MPSTLKNRSTKRKQKRYETSLNLSLQDKIEMNGGSNGYALEINDNYPKSETRQSSTRTNKFLKTPRDAYGRPKRNHEQSSIKSNSNGKNTTMRSFERKKSSISHDIVTPAYIHKHSAPQTSYIDQTPHNPYKKTMANYNVPPSSAKFTRRGGSSLFPSSQQHIVCSISENLARETCITAMDATSPTTIEIHKMANGQTYTETLTYLEMIQPHEVLLNEGRRNSQLCRKVVGLFNNGDTARFYGDFDHDSDGDSIAGQFGSTIKRKGKKNENVGLQTPAATSNAALKTPNTTVSDKGECQIQTIVKFLPRSYFDQTRGAELLQRVAHETSYEPSIINEYIVLSSSYGLISYIQSCLGSNFNKNSLKLSMNWGGKYRMAIDRNTISHLELLANAKTGKNKNSLIGTIDCTKTTVGSRLLRSNLMSPPTGISTINARLDLVDSFLEDEVFFYEVLDQLQALPDIDKMMAHIALRPNKQRATKTKRGDGKTRQVTARMASRGISALVCIKSILSVIPNFARVLEIQLKSLEKSKKSNSNEAQQSTDTGNDFHSMKATIQTQKRQKGSILESHDGGRNDDNSDSHLNWNETNEKPDISSDSDSESDSVTSKEMKTPRKTNSDDEEKASISVTSATNNSSLLIGLGGGEPTNNPDGSSIGTQHQLLRAILVTMKQPALREILDSVLDIFTESTTYSRNSHAMRHQECFALKPNTDGMMDVLRKAFLANVDDIYKLADEYNKTHGFTVVVKETAARGYYLSIPVSQVRELPNIFIQPVKSGKYYNCTTEEVSRLSMCQVSISYSFYSFLDIHDFLLPNTNYQVHSLNSRAQENVQDLLLMTHERIQECIENARQKYDALASLSDAIALIDMCHCFADNVASCRQPWCRPTVTDYCLGGTSNNNGIVGSGAIAIRNGRYAIDVSKTGLMVSEDGKTNHDYIPNDTYASAFQNFTVITGINGSGKR